VTIADACLLERLPRRSLSPRSCSLLAAGLVLLGFACLPLDVPLARLVQGDNSPTSLRKICGFAELFGHGVGVGCLMIIIAVLDPPRRVGLPRIGAAALSAGLAANIGKLLISRERPRNVNLDLIERGVDTFGAWFPLAGNSSGGQGFPSSHMATAAALVIVLVLYYPRGRWLFPLCALCAGLQRILSDAHFISDVCWGGAVGCLVAQVFVHGPVAAAFDRLESRWAAGKQVDAANLPLRAARQAKSAA
jgi:hypothetical protein